MNHLLWPTSFQTRPIEGTKGHLREQHARLRTSYCTRNCALLSSSAPEQFSDKHAGYLHWPAELETEAEDHSQEQFHGSGEDLVPPR
mmetsp:Transcript_43386/g.102169  ORF Transcript_43386/g.102169 Transcript_43386/m.102169 type:complete len:87 (+) Transcript_43386:80-340(+)